MTLTEPMIQTAMPVPVLAVESPGVALRRTGIALFILLWLVPPLLIAVMLWRYAVDEPFWDDFATGEVSRALTHQGYDWNLLISQHNESRLVFPRLVLHFLDTQSHWDVRYHMWTSFTCVFFTSLLLICVCLRTVQRPIAAFACAVLASFIFFSPVQWNDFLWAMMVIAFIPALLLAVILVVFDSKVKLWVAVPISAAAVIVATFSNASGMMLWVLAIPFFLVHPSKFRFAALGAWLVLTIGIVTYYFHGYVKPSYHPPVTVLFHQPVAAVKFLFAFLGNGVRQTVDPEQDFRLGWVVASVWAAGVLYVALIGRKIELWRKSLPWMIVGAYSIGSGAIATIGRLGFGPGAALADRYPAYSVPIWFAIVPLWIVIFECSIPKKIFLEKLGMLVSIAGGCAVAVMMIRGCLFVRRELLAFNAKMLAGRSAAQFILVAPDEEAIKKTIYPEAATPTRIITYMDREDLFHPECFHSNDISGIAASMTEGNAGIFDYMVAQGDQLVLGGWAYLPPRMTPADAVLLTTPDAAGVERVFAIVNDDRELRRDVATAMHCQKLDVAGWNKILDRTKLPHGAVVTAWAYDSYSRRAYRINGTHQNP